MLIRVIRPRDYLVLSVVVLPARLLYSHGYGPHVLVIMREEQAGRMRAAVVVRARVRRVRVAKTGHPELAVHDLDRHRPHVLVLASTVVGGGRQLLTDEGVWKYLLRSVVPSFSGIPDRGRDVSRQRPRNRRLVTNRVVPLVVPKVRHPHLSFNLQREAPGHRLARPQLGTQQVWLTSRRQAEVRVELDQVGAKGGP